MRVRRVGVETRRWPDRWAAWVAIFALVLPAPATATCGGGGGGGSGGISGEGGERAVYRVPWKVLAAGVPDGDLKLLWLPGSALEARASALLESRYLTLAAGQCVGFGLLPPENPVRVALAPAGSTVVLVDGTGVEVVRLAVSEGELAPKAVEKLLKSELERRKAEVEVSYEQALAKKIAGETAAAVELFEQVWSQRCLFPSAAKRAARELKKLGHDRDEDAAVERELAEPGDEVGAAIEVELRAGLEAESRLALDEAKARYENAVRLDANDPVALRYLAEYHRHHSGDWDEAKRLFARILGLAADPVSRAVALHGLGKMTIHGGDFAAGLDLIRASTAAWPLPLAYRNLAVYWFSERQLEVAKGYMDQALALAPDDPYNQIFAAVYLVEMGRPDEARAIVAEHADLLEASYNLAAVWARLGERERMLELLARHFFEYERYEAVRVREMREARDDHVFAQYFADPGFVELTRGAELDPDSYHRQE